MRKAYFTLFILCFQISVAQNTNFARYVNPFIGTGGHGHTFPGAKFVDFNAYKSDVLHF